MESITSAYVDEVLDETAYLLSTPANRGHLLSELNDIHAKKISFHVSFAADPAVG